MSEKYLLDTCAVIFLSQGEGLADKAIKTLKAAEAEQPIFISPVTALELSLLISKGRLRSTMNAFDYFNSFLDDSGARLCTLTAEVLARTYYLPGRLHGDPADRMLISTARFLDMTLVTRDSAILAYSAAGHVKTLAC